MATITTPPAFPLRVLYCFQPRAIGHQDSRLLFILLVIVLSLVLLDVKWLLISHYIESKNPREDQYSVNHGLVLVLEIIYLMNTPSPVLIRTTSPKLTKDLGLHSPLVTRGSHLNATPQACLAPFQSAVDSSSPALAQ